MTVKSGSIYIGIGGWTFEPWRGEFYPKGLPHAKELAYAAERLTSIEINGTFYRTQTPATFRKWASEVPNGFKFSLKGPRFATNRRVLKEAGDSIKRFLDSGITELGGHLGPLLWQFAPTKKFDASDFGGFLELLPAKFGGQTLRHVIEVRHDSFRNGEFIALLRKFDMPVVYTDHVKYPNIADATGTFIYARLQRGKDSVPTAYPPKDIKAWASRLRTMAEGDEPAELPRVAAPAARKPSPREVFAYHPRRQNPRPGGRNGADRSNWEERIAPSEWKEGTCPTRHSLLKNANGHERKGARTSGVASSSWPSREGAVAHVTPQLDGYATAATQGDRL